MIRRNLIKALCILILSGAGIFIFSLMKHKNDILKQSQRIYTILNEHRIEYDIDEHSINSTSDTATQASVGVEQCLQNISYFVTRNKPITMLLVGFPFKSNNVEEKVISTLPDMAERKSLEYLQEIVNEIKKVYSPGAKIMIFCDGIPFAEFLGIPFDQVTLYEKTLKQLAADLVDITIYTSENMLNTHTFSNLLEIINHIDQYPPSDKEFKETLKSIPETILKRIALELNYPQGKLLLKKHSLEDIVIALSAREMRLRSYIAKAFPSPDFFRLTVHFTKDISKKFGIRLSPTSDITPYHGTLVEEIDGSWAIRFKKDIDKDYYQLQSRLINGIKCNYFKRIN